MDTVQTLAWLAFSPWKADLTCGAALAADDDAQRRALGAALERACRQAWKALAVVLAGDSFWEGSKLFLSDKEHHTLAEHVAQLRAQLLAVLPPDQWAEGRLICRQELQGVQQAGWLPGPGLETPERLDQVLTCQPPGATPQEQEANQVRLLAQQVRAAGLVTVSRLLQTPPGGPLPLLVRAARCWLSSQLGITREAKKGEEGPRSDETAEPALTFLLRILDQYGPGLQEWLLEETTATPALHQMRSATAAEERAPSPAPTGNWSPSDAPGEETAPPALPAAQAASGNPSGSPARQRFWGIVLPFLVLTIPVVLVLWLIYRYALREVRQFQGHTAAVVQARFSPDGRYVLSASADRTLRLWDVASGEEVRRLTGHTAGITTLDLSADGRWAASGGDDGLRLWDLTTGQELWHQSIPPKGICCLALSPDGQRLCAASPGESLIRVWDAQARRLLCTLAGHTDGVQALTYSPDGVWLASAGARTVRLWSVAQGQEVRRFQGPEESVTCLAFSADGRWLAAGAQEGVIRLWDVAGGQELDHYFLAAPVRSVALSPDGRLLAAGTARPPDPPEFLSRARRRSYCLHLWRLGSDAEAAYPDTPQDLGAVWSVAFSPDGRYLLSAGEDQKIHLWHSP